MPKDKIGQIIEKLDSYIISHSKIEPFVFIFGEEENAESTKMFQDLSISSMQSLGELTKVLTSFSKTTKRFLNGELSVKDLDDGIDHSGIFYKKMDQNDFDRTKYLIDPIYQKTQFSDFLKPSKSKNVFLGIEINLDNPSNDKIVLLKSISQNYYAKKSKYSITSLFNENPKITFINNEEDLLFDSNFEIVGNISDLDNSFFFIQNIKKFEDLFKYHEKYEESFSSLSQRLNFIDWSNAEATMQVKRSCYDIANFDRLDECIAQLTKDLTSKDENEIKQALCSKGITYDVDKGGNVKVIPKNTKELRAILKIISDGVAKTCLLGRNVLGTNFEELE